MINFAIRLLSPSRYQWHHDTGIQICSVCPDCRQIYLSRLTAYRDVAPVDGDFPDPDGYNGRESPVYGEFEEKYMTDVRCGRDGAKSASTTETATIEAGSAVAFHIKEYKDTSYNNGIFHPGPAQVYMSKSENLATDVGDGDWFKIYYLGPNSDTTWATDRATQVNMPLTLLS